MAHKVWMAPIPDEDSDGRPEAVTIEDSNTFQVADDGTLALLNVKKICGAKVGARGGDQEGAAEIILIAAFAPGRWIRVEEIKKGV